MKYPKKKELERYIFENYKSLLAFAIDLGVSNVTLWNWLTGRFRPNNRHAHLIEKITKGEVTKDYMRQKPLEQPIQKTLKEGSLTEAFFSSNEPKKQPLHQDEPIVSWHLRQSQLTE